MENEKRTNEKRFAYLEFNHKLKVLRREQGLNIEEIANNIGIKKDIYDSFESEKEYHRYTNDHIKDALQKIKEYYSKIENFTKHDDPYIMENEYKRTELAMKIIRQRKKIGDNQQELANVIQVDDFSIASWESAERTPNERCLKLLDQYLGSIL